MYIYKKQSYVIRAPQWDTNVVGGCVDLQGQIYIDDISDIAITDSRLKMVMDYCMRMGIYA